jgi:hypothetical protein
MMANQILASFLPGRNQEPRKRQAYACVFQDRRREVRSHKLIQSSYHSDANQERTYRLNTEPEPQHRVDHDFLDADI